MSVVRDWMTAKDAAAALDVPGPKNVRKLAGEGLINVRSLPGVRAKYSRADVERLARSAEPAAARAAS